MKKGFTLIELLAVIVILAIITLIATPIVLDIIEDSKNSSIRESVNMYKSAAENAIAVSAMNDGLEDGTYIIDNKGNLKYKNKEIKVDVKNYNFEYGILVIEQGQIKDIKLIQSDKVTTGKELNKIDKWDGKTIKEVTEDSNGIYHITKASELAWVAQQVNSGEPFEGKTISLDASLDLGGRYDKDGKKLGTEWTPIGIKKSDTESFPFKGTFEGNNNIISGIYINKPQEDLTENQYLGLFGYVRTGELKNLVLKDSYVSGYGYSGILCGVSNSYSKVNNITVFDSYINSITRVGLVLGFTSRVSANNAISYNGVVKGKDRIGGVIGELRTNSELNNSYSNVNVVNDGTVRLSGTGGIVGLSYGSILDNLISMSKVSGYSDVGGVVGHFENGSKLTNSVSYADVSGTNMIGGVIGACSGYSGDNFLENIKSYAKVTEKDSNTGVELGGVIGHLSQGNNYLTNIYSKSNVKGNDKVGGIIGGFEINYATTLNYKNVISESTIEGETNKGELWGYTDSTSVINSLD